MAAQDAVFRLWIHREQAVVSFHPIHGYELLHFRTRELFQAKLQILMQAGFRFQ